MTHLLKSRLTNIVVRPNFLLLPVRSCNGACPANDRKTQPSLSLLRVWHFFKSLVYCTSSPATIPLYAYFRHPGIEGISPRVAGLINPGSCAMLAHFESLSGMLTRFTFAPRSGPILTHGKPDATVSNIVQCLPCPVARVFHMAQKMLRFKSQWQTLTLGNSA